MPSSLWREVIAWHRVYVSPLNYVPSFLFSRTRGRVLALLQADMPQAASQLASDPAILPQGTAQNNSARWEQLSNLPCAISIDVSVPQFRLRDLIELRRDSIVSSRLQTSSSVPLRVNGELIAWGDFEVLGTGLCVRLTELV